MIFEMDLQYSDLLSTMFHYKRSFTSMTTLKTKKMTAITAGLCMAAALSIGTAIAAPTTTVPTAPDAPVTGQSLSAMKAGILAKMQFVRGCVKKANTFTALHACFIPPFPVLRANVLHELEIHHAPSSEVACVKAASTINGMRSCLAVSQPATAPGQ
jgi:hypothetical protein